MKDIKIPSDRKLLPCKCHFDTGKKFVCGTMCDMITWLDLLSVCIYCGRDTVIIAQRQCPFFDVNTFRVPNTQLDTLSLLTTFYEHCRENQFYDMFVGYIVYPFSHTTKPITQNCTCTFYYSKEKYKLNDNRSVGTVMISFFYVFFSLLFDWCCTFERILVLLVPHVWFSSNAFKCSHALQSFSQEKKIE